MKNKEFYKVRKNLLLFEQEAETEIRSDLEKNVVNNTFKSFE